MMFRLFILKRLCLCVALFFATGFIWADPVFSGTSFEKISEGHAWLLQWVATVLLLVVLVILIVLLVVRFWPKEEGPKGLSYPHFQVPEQVGPYLIDQVLGHGAFATTYLAYHAVTRRRVALKILHPFRHGDPEYVARFLQEAMVGATLRHPNLVRILDTVTATEDDMKALLGPLLKISESKTLIERVKESAIVREQTRTFIPPIAQDADGKVLEGKQGWDDFTFVSFVASSMGSKAGHACAGPELQMGELPSDVYTIRPEMPIWLAMEYVQGQRLDQMLGEPLPLQDVLRISFAVAQALAYAHSKGVVHRDIKPSNIMLSGRLVKVMDFGVAKVMGGDSITATYTFLGTPAYAAPEIQTGVGVGPEADTYSFGIMMFEMLTGRPPFVGKTPFETIEMHRHQKLPGIATLRPETPASLVALVESLCRKNPAERPKDEQVLTRLKEI